MQYNVVVLRGEEARKGYFDNKDFNPSQGYKVFTGVRLSPLLLINELTSECFSLGPFD